MSSTTYPSLATIPFTKVQATTRSTKYTSTQSYKTPKKSNLDCDDIPGITVYNASLSTTYVVKIDCDCPALVFESMDATATAEHRLGFNCTIPIGSTTSSGIASITEATATLATRSSSRTTGGSTATTVASTARFSQGAQSGTISIRQGNPILIVVISLAIIVISVSW